MKITFSCGNYNIFTFFSCCLPETRTKDHRKRSPFFEFQAKYLCPELETSGLSIGRIPTQLITKDLSFSSRKGNLPYRIRKTVSKRYRRWRSGIFSLSEFEHDWDNFRAYSHALPKQKLRLKETNISNLICSSDYDTSADVTLFRVSQTVLTNLIKKRKFCFSL